MRKLFVILVILLPFLALGQAPYKVMVFLQKDCPCSSNHLEHLKQLNTEYKTTFQFQGQVLDPQTTEVEKYFSDLKLGFQLVFDSDKKMANKMKALKTPHVFVLKGDDVLYQGGVTNSLDPKRASGLYLKEVLATVQKTGKAPYSYKRALGCYIKR